MAEVFGVVSGAFGIVSIFRTCLKCFEHIQTGRRFDKDFQTNTLTLDLLRSRLLRWGEAVRVCDPQFGDSTAREADVKLAKDVLCQILVLLVDSGEVSNKYRPQSGLRKGLSTLSSDDMGAEISALINNMGDFADQHRKKTNLSKLVRWTLHDKRYHSELIESIAKLLDQLEKVFPAPEMEKVLVEEKINKIDDGKTGNIATSKLSHDLAAGVDNVGKAGTVDMISTRGTSFGQIMVNENARVRNGDVITAAWRGETVLPTGGANMNVVIIETGGNARVHNGNTYTDEDNFWN